MKTFFKIFTGIVVLILVVGLILDNKVNVSRQIEINATPEQVHFYLDDLQQWPKWSPWADMDPTIITEIGKISSGVGADQSWTSQSGAGYLKITHSSPIDGIVYDLSFEGDSTVYESGMRISVDNNKTMVTWFMTGEMQPIIIGNYFAQMMDMFVGDSFMNGLEKLKLAVESQQ